MPKRVPVSGIHVHRDGKLVRPKLGVPFDFTAEELDDINRLNPGAITKIVTSELKDEDPAILKARAEQEQRDAEEQRTAQARAEQERIERLRKAEEEEKARVAKEQEQAEANAKSAASKGKGKGAASADSL